MSFAFWPSSSVLMLSSISLNFSFWTLFSFVAFLRSVNLWYFVVMALVYLDSLSFQCKALMILDAPS